MKILQILSEDECADCGEPKERAICSICGDEAEVINCGHYEQPQPIAASAHSPYEWTCERCEKKLNRNR